MAKRHFQTAVDTRGRVLGAMPYCAVFIVTGVSMISESCAEWILTPYEAGARSISRAVHPAVERVFAILRSGARNEEKPVDAQYFSPNVSNSNRSYTLASSKTSRRPPCSGSASSIGSSRGSDHKPITWASVGDATRGLGDH